MDPIDLTSILNSLSYGATRLTRLNRKAIATRAFNALVVLSMLVPGMIPMNATAAELPAAPEEMNPAEILPNREPEIEGFQPPAFTHPAPRIGERNDIATAPRQTRGERTPIPLMFIENVGQFDSEELYRVRGAFSTVHISEDEIWVTALERPSGLDDYEAIEGRPIKGAHLRLTFPGSNAKPVIEGIDPVDSQISFFYGNDPRSWKTDVPVWSGVSIKDLYPGADLEISGERGSWTWRFVLKDLESSSLGQIGRIKSIASRINLKITGTKGIALNDELLLLSTGFSEIGLPLIDIIDSNGVSVSHELVPPGLNGDVINAPFQRGVQDRDDSPNDTSLEDSNLENQDSNTNHTIGTGGKLTLIVGPQHLPVQILPPQIPNPSGQDDLIFSTFLGGNSNDTILGIDINSAGEVFVAGGTASPDFPTTPGAFDTTSNGGGFITKFNNDASELVYSTFIGDGGATDIKADDYGAAYITGITSSVDFPTTLGAFDTTHNGSSDAFILKLNSAGDQLVYSTFYGGSLADNGRSIAINEMGEAFITGVTSSTDLPTSPTAVQPVIAGGADVFVARMSADGDQIIYSTYLGGSDADGFADIAIDAIDSAYIAGTTSSTDYPTTSGAYQIVCASCPDDTDIFISKLSPDGNSLEYSTYLGGGDQEDKVALTVDPEGHAYITGVTIIGNQPDFPTTPGVFQPNSINLCDAFVTRLNLDGSQLDYSTFLGGRGCDEGKDIAIDAVGNAYVTGTTQDAFITPFPTTPDAFQPTYRGGSTDGFVSKINQNGTELVYSTFLGGNSIDEPWTIVVDPSGAGYIAGNTYSQDFPVSPNAFQTTRDEGSYDSFVTKLSMGAQESIVSERAVLDTAGAEICPNPETQGTVAGPINTRTGGYDYNTLDISISTSAGPLTFQRTYASLGVDLYQEPLGPGWTHNHDIRLIFSGDPGGEPGLVRFKAQTTNQHDYIDNGDGTYTAAPGVCGTLVKDDGPPITYTLTDQGQNQYVFDENGVLLTFSDPSGHSWTYSYDINELLGSITDDSGQGSLDIYYDENDLIETIFDHSGRYIDYAYDFNGNLTEFYDVLEEVWEYSYDTEHRLTEVVDPRGVTVERTEFDAQGRAYRQYNGEDELIVEITYNPDGTSTVTDARNNSATHTYDSRKTITDIEDPLGGSSDKVYDLNFRPTSLTDEIGDVTQLSWSGDGANLTQVLDAEGNLTDLTYDELNNLTDVVDPRNFLTTYEYSGTFLTTTTDALNNTTTYTYTPEGYLESVTDARNNSTSYGYDSVGQRTSMTDALNNTWTYTYDDLGRLIDTTDPLGRVTHSQYDETGRLIKVTRNYDMFRPQNDQEEYNIVTEHEYDEVGNQILVRDTFGTETYYEYDDANRLVTTRDFQGHETTNVYDNAGNLISTTDALNRTTTYVYDELNRLTTTIDQMGESTSTAYNPDGTVESTTDALNRTTTYTYDSLKRVVSTEDPLGGDTSTEYDEAGNVISTTDAEDRTTTYEYDALGRLILQTDPLNGETEHFYDEVGNRVQTIDANNNATTYAYDELNRLETVTDAKGRTTTYAYDSVGNRVTVTNARDYATTYTYDGLDRLVEVEDPLGNSTETQYDAMSNVFIRKDANGNPTTYSYDLLNRLILEADAEGGYTELTYDAVGNQLTVTDANDHTMITVYDDLNRPVTVTDPLGNTTTTNYDEVGNVTSVTDDLNNTTSFTYDDLNRQESVTDPESHTTYYGYDSVGNRTLMTDANGIETRYEYDDLNRLAAVVENYDSGADPDHEYNVRTEYAYDAVGNRLTIQDGNNHVTTFVYNELNQLTQEEDAVGIRNFYYYDTVGNRIRTQDHNDVAIHYWYDAANRLTHINYPSPDPDVDFDYDAAGNRTSMVDGVGTTTWTYDQLNRVTNVNDPFGDDVGYDYDAVGNRTELTYPDLKIVEYTYDAANRMTDVLDWDSQTTSYTYDDANRLLTTLLPNGVTSSYAYDDAGNILSIIHATATDTLSSFTYTYDAVGNRTQAEEMVVLPVGGIAALVGEGKLAEAASTKPLLSQVSMPALEPARNTVHASTSSVVSSAIVTHPVRVVSSMLQDDPTPTLIPGEEDTTTPTTSTEGETTPDATVSPIASATSEATASASSTPTTLPTATPTPGATLPETATPPERAISQLSGLPLSIVPNRGQTDESVLFHVHSLGGEQLYFLRTGFQLVLPREPVDAQLLDESFLETTEPPVVVSLAFEGVNPGLRLEAEGRMPGEVNYYVGSDPVSWQAHLPIYDSLEYIEIYPGVDLQYEGTQGILKGSFVVTPGADPDQIRWRYEDAAGIWLDETSGDLIVEPRTAACPEGQDPTACEAEREAIVERAPVAWQERGGERVPVEVGYALEKDGSVGFEIGAYDPSLPLVLDPTLTYSTYLGGSGYDAGFDVGTDDEGNLYLVGRTLSINFPTENPIQGSKGGMDDAFITKLSPDGSTLIYSTYLGGTDGTGEAALGVAVEGGGAAYMTGLTDATDFPLLNPAQTSPGGDHDAFVSKLNPDGTLSYSTYLGGSGQEGGGTKPIRKKLNIAVDSSGSSYVAGVTDSTDFPLYNPYQASLAGGTEAFLTRLSPDGSSFTFSTYLGGAADDRATNLGIDSSGYVSLVGYSASTDFPIANALQPDCGGTSCDDAFLTKMDPAGPALVFSTYLGGSNRDEALGIHVDSGGEILLGGYTYSTDFPVLNAWQESRAGGKDGFIAKVAADGSSLIFSTYLGGTEGEDVYELDVDAEGFIHAVGKVKSDDFPTVDPVQSTHGGLQDAFAARLTSEGIVTFSTYLGGSHTDEAWGVVADGESSSLLGGFTYSDDFPVVDPFQGSRGGSMDAFIAKIEHEAAPPQVWEAMITYTYDPLYRLTEADYSIGEYFWYTYDAVGNRMSQETHEDLNSYVYDDANKLVDVDGVAYTWDVNGNLLSDGVSTYTYDHANRLNSVAQGTDAYTFSYNGLGDRLSQSVNGGLTDYTLDLAAGLTQVLDDGTNGYLYGIGRIGEEQLAAGWQYHQGDALGSVRQLTDSSPEVTKSESYQPFGEELQGASGIQSGYGFTGEYSDSSQLIHLRARYYSPHQGRFITHDIWEGDPNQPMSYNRWLYVAANPVNRTDPSGFCEYSGYKYCRIIGGPYDGAIIDLHHYDDSKQIASEIRLDLSLAKGDDPGRLPVRTLQAGRIWLTREYLTWLPEDISGPILDRISLGIFMDFQWNIESLQSIPCYLGVPCSGFANEDLPSDYLGWVAAVVVPRGWSLNDILNNKLGAESGEPTDDLGPYKADWIDTIRCFRFGDCGEFNPYNMDCDFTFKIFVEESGTFTNVPWPTDLQIEPVGPGQYWNVPQDILGFDITLK